MATDRSNHTGPREQIVAAEDWRRSAAFAGTALIIPAAIALFPVLAAFRLNGDPWSWTNPWTWFALALITVTATAVLAHPVAVLFRRMLACWSNIRLTSGYRTVPDPVRLSTEFWWNGASPERARDDARADLRMRRALEPAFRREVRWALVAAIAVLPVCGVPMAALVGAALLFVLATLVSIALGCGLVVLALAVSPFVWRIAGPWAARWLAVPSNAGLSAVHHRTQFPRPLWVRRRPPSIQRMAPAADPATDGCSSANRVEMLTEICPG